MRPELSEGQFPFVARLSARGRDELRALRAHSAAPHQKLLKRGDAVGGAYFVLSGGLRVYYLAADGHEATLYRVDAGDTCVLALTSSFAHEPYPAWVEAGAKGGSFVRVPQRVLHTLFDTEPALREFVWRVLSRRVFDLMRTIEEIGSNSLEQRLALYLARHADASGILRASQSALASELGTAREVVSRALRSLVRRGFARAGRGRIELVDRAALLGMANVADEH
ncbi:MAG: Crp/Fnr family transcriptional regulator [Myxococcota bacterium]